MNQAEEFKYLMRLREKAKHDEAEAIYSAQKRRDEHWQGVVADKDTTLADKNAENEKLKSMLAELQIKLGVRA